MIKTEWHITSSQKSLLSSLALLTAAIGAIAFGRIADRLGRKRSTATRRWCWRPARSPRRSRRVSGG